MTKEEELQVFREWEDFWQEIRKKSRELSEKEMSEYMENLIDSKSSQEEPEE